MAGAETVVTAPAVSFGAVADRPMRTKLFPNSPTLTMKSRLGLNKLNWPSKYTNPPNPIFENSILAALLPCCPALWISDAATDSGKGRSGSSTITRRSRVTKRMPSTPPTSISNDDLR